ncbi:MAG: DUF4112 domain-containing protein [Planctomycetes bacterium]|nr:DUF4112 domain-containing protein [Planctomycetota bacterium]
MLTRDEKGELAIVRAIRKWMDEAVTVPGTRLKIGLDSVIGLIPGVGDLSGAAIGGYMLHAAHKLGVPTVVMVRMLVNLAIDTLIGLIPVVGDYLDVLYKANSKNAALIERAILDRETTARASWWRLIGVFAAFLVIVLGGIAGTVFLVKWLWTAMG